jgi:ketosteroid isomerase-like protein
MTIRIRGAHLGTLIVALAGLAFAPLAGADDKDDIMALIAQYGELEDDLEKQADLIRDDRVMITNIRQTDNAKNMEIQMATRKANDAVNGGKTRWITTIESPKVAVYGDTAVASFVRTFTILPHNQAPINGSPNWVTLVLVKDDGEWGIAHTHMSSAGGN